MEIVQVDSNVIKITQCGLTFNLSYSFSWDNIVRYPESVVLDGSRVNAFFPTSTIKDSITENEDGFSIRRSWYIIPAGEIAFSFSLDLLGGGTVPYLFPGAASGEKIPSQAVGFLGERLSVPSGVFLFPDGKSVLIAASFPQSGDEQGGIAVNRVSGEGGRRTRTEIMYPPREAFPPQIEGTRGYI